MVRATCCSDHYKKTKGFFLCTATEGVQSVSPRVFQVNALPVPTDRQKTQMYFLRYFERFPAAGQIGVSFHMSFING